MDQINKEMREAEKTLTELNKCCGLCVCPCSRTKNFESSNAYKATWGDGGASSSSNIVSKQPGRVTNGQPQQATVGASSGGYIKRYASSSQYFYPFPKWMSFSGGWVYLAMNCNLSIRNSIYFLGGIVGFFMVFFFFLAAEHVGS